MYWSNEQLSTGNGGSNYPVDTGTRTHESGVKSKITNTGRITGVMEKASVKKTSATFGGPSNISTNGRSL